MGQEYELEKKVHGGDRKSEEFRESSTQSEDLKPEKTSERLAKEHSVSRATVERSADLYKTVESIKEIAPEVAQKEMSPGGPGSFWPD